MDSEQVIKEANAYIDEIESGCRKVDKWHMPWLVIFMALILAGLFFYQQYQIKELRETNQILSKQLNEFTGNEVLSKIIGAKIMLARVEIQRKEQSIPLLVGLVLGSGISLLIFNKRCKRQAKIMRGLIQLVQKNS